MRNPVPSTTPTVRTYHLTTPNTPDVARFARDHVAHLIRHTACPVETDTARLLVSEIVANAYQHTASPIVGLTTILRPTGLRVSVYDADPSRLPTRPNPTTPCAAEHGRGLNLVQTCAASWGYTIHGGTTPFGKSVYFVLVAGGVRAVRDARQSSAGA